MELNASTSSNITNERVIWAIDGFSHRPDLESAHLDWVEEFTASKYAQIEPVFALDDIQIEKAWAHPDATSNLQQIVGSATVPRVGTETILRDAPPPYFTERKAVQSMLKHAVETRSDLIVLHSHPVSKIRRMIAGTFVETMVQHSAVPLLILTDHVDQRRPIREILFYMDPSSAWFPAARRCIEQAVQVGAKEVVIFEAQPSRGGAMNSGMRQSGGRGIQKMIDLARQAGIRLSRIRSDDGIDLTDEIIGVARSEDIDLIVLPFPLDGSLRNYPTELLVESTQPIWIV